MKRAVAWKVIHTPGGWHLQGPSRQAAEANRFLERTDLRGLAPGSLRTYAYDLLALLRWSGKRALPETVPEAYFEFVRHCRDRIHPSTINRRLRLLQHVIRFFRPETAPRAIPSPRRRHGHCLPLVRQPVTMKPPLNEEEVRKNKGTDNIRRLHCGGEVGRLAAKDVGRAWVGIEEGWAMRTARLFGDGRAYYHVISRVIERRFALDEGEKERIRQTMRKMESFTGVRILTYAIMDNHFHLLVEADSDAQVSDADVIRRVGEMYGREQAKSLKSGLAAGGEQAAEVAKALDKYRGRMNNLSLFMKTLMQRISQSYNSRNKRRGPLWEDRFKSVLVEGRRGEALGMIAAYIDLNAVRAGLVRDPRAYPFCGYGEAVAGSRRARAGLTTVLAVMGPNRWDAERYRDLLNMQALAHEKGVAKGEDFRARAETALAQKGKLTAEELLHCRVRYFSDGVALGSKAFVEDVFKRNRDQFGLRRKNGARRIKPLAGEGLFTMRDLRLTPVTVSATAG